MRIFSVVFVVGAGIRCFATGPSTFWLVIVGQVRFKKIVYNDFIQALNGCIGPLTLSACPRISALWFAVNERTTATAISRLNIHIPFVIISAIGVGWVLPLDF
jgi:hypothetical protein